MDPVEAEAHARARRGGRSRGGLSPDHGRAARAREGRGPVEPVPARRGARARADQLGVRDALRADGPLGRRRAHGRSTARRRTPATWRSWPSTAPPSRSERWLEPLLNDHMRSCFSMTEPETAGSDPTGLAARAELDGGEWVINGHKWFTSGYNGAAVAIVDGGHRPRRGTAPPREHDPGADRHAGFHRRPPGAGDGPRRGPGPLGGHLRGRASARGQPAGRARRRLLDRPGPPRARPHPPLHARHRLGRARFRAHVQARARARGLRRQAGGEAVRPGLHRQVAHGDRRGAADGPARGLEDGHRGQARRAGRRSR